MTSGGGTGARARLEEERDRLLRSLDRLDQELEAGELDETDYKELSDDVTRRAADVLRRLDGVTTTAPPPAPGSRLRPMILAGVLVFAVLAGLALARASGERGVNGQLTGGIDESPRDQVVRCQALGSSGGDLVGALECFDEVLAADPENAEALTYRGWYLVLAAGALQQSASEPDSTGATDGVAGVPVVGEAEIAELWASARDYLDRAIAVDPGYPDPLAFRAVLYDRAGESEEACADIAALLALDPPELFVTQTSGVADRNGC